MEHVITGLWAIAYCVAIIVIIFILIALFHTIAEYGDEYPITFTICAIILVGVTVGIISYLAS